MQQHSCAYIKSWPITRRGHCWITKLLVFYQEASSSNKKSFYATRRRQTGNLYSSITGSTKRHSLLKTMLSVVADAAKRRLLRPKPPSSGSNLQYQRTLHHIIGFIFKVCHALSGCAMLDPVTSKSPFQSKLSLIFVQKVDQV